MQNNSVARDTRTIIAASQDDITGRAARCKALTTPHLVFTLNFFITRA